jgi:hypothetical protein
MKEERKRKHSLCSAAALVLLLLVAMAPSADAALRLKLIGKSVTRLYSDGARWAAYEPSVGTTRVIDASTGRAVDRPNPRGCDYSPHGGGLVAVGGGELLYSCEASGCLFIYSGCPGPNREYWQGRYIVEDAATGREHEVSRLPFDPEGPYLDTIGSQWSGGEAVAYRYRHVFYLNWRTGQVESPTENPATSGIDLDSATVMRPFCTPVRRILNLGFYKESEPEPLYSPPFAIERRKIKVPGFELNSGVEIALRHCGSQRRERLSLSRSDMTSAQLGADIVSWIALGKNGSGAMYATQLNDHNRRWHGPIFHLLGPKYPSHVKIAQTWMLQHTSTTVYQSVPVEEAEKGPTLIYGIRLP